MEYHPNDLLADLTGLNQATEVTARLLEPKTRID